MFNFWLGVISILIGLGITIVILKGKNLFDFDKKKKESEEILQKSQEEVDKLLRVTKQTVQKSRELMEEDIQRSEKRIEKIKESLNQREKTLEKKKDRINEIKLRIASEQEAIQSTEEATKRADKEFIENLAIKTKSPVSQLQEEIVRRYGIDLENENKQKLSHLEEEAKENANKRAKKIVMTAIQRFTLPTSTESKVITVIVPKDHIKGKIVGKDGKNIQFFEKTMEDVEIVFNDLPNTISISSYNLVKRRIAQKAIEKLVNSKKKIFDETVIKESIKIAEKEMDDELYEIGKKAITKMGIKEKNKDLTKIIGRLKFRTSYGQNILKHSMEVAWIAEMLGQELGLNVEVLKTGAFLHDLGKAIDQDPEIEGTHDHLTKELMEKYGYSEEEVHAAWTHHDAEAQQTPEAIIVKAADAVSAARPGARRESIEKYLERLRALEEAARSFEGVKHTYAISAGRELRVFVDPQKVVDESTLKLAENVAEKIEENIAYPGKIKVNIIRRTNCIEVAK